MAVDAPTVTAEQLERLSKGGRRLELVRGEPRELMAPGFEHGRVAATVALLLGAHVRASRCGVAVGETGFVIERHPDTVRAPDAAFVSAARAAQVGPTSKYWPGAPDLAVEVVSPGDSFREVQEKALHWLAAGTLAVLVLDPGQRTATLYAHGGHAQIPHPGQTLDLSHVVPGFRVAVAELFD